MKQNKIIVVMLVCVIIGLGMSTMRATASTSVASLWTLDGSGNPILFKTYDAGQDGWKAVSYKRYSNGWATMLWTMDNKASLWMINASGAIVSFKTYSPGAASPAWRATSYELYSSNWARLLWTRDNAASLWTINPSGDAVGFQSYSPGAASPAWQATSYEYYSSGWARMMWTRDNSASLWTINPDGTAVGFKSYSPGSASPAWQATSYTWDVSTQYGKMVWTRPNGGSVWTINPAGSVVAFKSYTPGSTVWTAQSYDSPGGIAAVAKTAEAFSLEVLIVKKAGNGSGTVSAGAQVCDAACQELIIPYVAGEKADLTVTPAAGSSFAGWQTAEGVALENIYYANPGDTVYAIFNQQ